MIKQILIIALMVGMSGVGLAQTTDTPAAELNSAPPALAPVSQMPISPAASEVVKTRPLRKLSYGLTAGTQFSSLFGTATYLEPSVMFPVTKRFSGYASINYITAFGPNKHIFSNQENAGNYMRTANHRVILNAGGNYMVNDRLNLTGSIWRDLSKNPMPAGVNLLMPGGSNGMSLRAHYKVSEHFSVSGGIRYSNGNAYQNGWYNPGSSFGY